MATKSRIVLAIPDQERLAAASALVDESAEIELAGTAHLPEQIESTLAGADVDCVVIDEHVGALPIMELVRQLSTAHPGVGLIVLVRDATPQILRAALQAGARDVLEQPLTLERLQASVSATVGWADAVREQITSDRTAHSDRLEAGKVIAVAGAKGGVGATTVALNLALAAAAVDGRHPPCLVELDLQAGDLRSYLDLPPSQHRSLGDLEGVEGELSWRALDDVLYAHESGVRVLLCPERGEDAEDVSDALIRETLGVTKAHSPLTIVDLGSNVTEAGAAAVELADQILIIATPDVPALRGANRLLRLWDRLDLVIQPDVVAVALNRVNRAAEVQPDLARRVLSCPLADAGIPAGFRDLESAINAGAPDRLSSGSVHDGLTQLAVEVGAIPEPKRRRRSSESGQVAIETLGLTGIICVLVLVVWQIVLVGYTFVLTGHSAREGARAMAVGEEGEQVARGEVPGAWRDGFRYDDFDGDEEDEAHAEVSLAVPVLIPGLETPFRITVDESTVIEDESLPDSVTDDDDDSGPEEDPPPEEPPDGGTPT